MKGATYTLGLFFIVLVAVIWAGSSVLTQYLYTSDSFDSPFLLTYIGVSLFTLWLPANCLSEWLFGSSSSSSSSGTTSSNNGGGVELGQRTAYQSVSSADELEEDSASHHQNTRTLAISGTHWTHADHRHAALFIAPVWFAANWTYNASLAYTSITSSTVLASTGSLFTFLFAVCSGDEGFTHFKLVGVLLGVLGSTLTAWQDGSSSDADHSESGVRALWGDILGLLSAVGYGAYAVQTRLLCPHDESRFSMQVLLGYIGLFCMTALSPIAFYCLFFKYTGLTWMVFGFLVFKGLMDNVLSDYLWLRAVMLTSATVATVGLGLTIPLALLSDAFYFQKDGVWSFGSVGGALSVLFGFVFVNIGGGDPEEGTNFEHSPTWDGDMLPVDTVADSLDDGLPGPAFRDVEQNMKDKGNCVVESEATENPLVVD